MKATRPILLRFTVTIRSNPMKAVCVTILIALATTSVSAQPRDGKMKELSLSGSYQNYDKGTSSGSTGALLLSARLGFIAKFGLELEPEFLFMAGSRGDPVYVLNGNVAYNFVSSGRNVPFILIGYGIANTVPFLDVPSMVPGFMVGVLNIGGGFKVFLKEDIAIRLEYRFQKFSGNGEKINFGYYIYDPSVDVRLHTVHFGISILV